MNKHNDDNHHNDNHQTEDENEFKTTSGYVALIGRPNVGKSTLLNHLLSEKVSITSRKPQTTRHRILGIKTIQDAQIIFVDTPGMHLGERRLLNRHMNRAAKNALQDVDVVVFLIDSLKWSEEDEWILSLLKNLKKPVILGVNKSDTVSDKTSLLPLLKEMAQKYQFAEIIPISARKGTNLKTLEAKILTLLPKGPHYFPSDAVTDKTPRFRIAELIREKLTRALGAEIPYSITVEIEKFQDEAKLATIHAVIWVEREGQKPIVIGKRGERLKELGTRARLDIEKLLGKKVHLRLWVKVRGGWSDDERALASLGFIDLT